MEEDFNVGNETTTDKGLSPKNQDTEIAEAPQPDDVILNPEFHLPPFSEPGSDNDLDSLLALEESLLQYEISKQSGFSQVEIVEANVGPAHKKVNLGPENSTRITSQGDKRQEANFGKCKQDSLDYIKPKSTSRYQEIDYLKPSSHGRLLTARNSQGQLLFIPQRSEASKRFDSSLLKKNQANKRGLLTSSIYAILDRIDLEKNTPQVFKQDLKSTKKRGKDPAPKLWCEKYRPKKFLDLIGDQRLNREALEWLKQWDLCVFNKRAPKFQPTFLKPNENHFQSSDPLGRPEQKVLLLCGPPGLGKTSLAHAIGQQCGYNCIEINASDDRTATVVKERIVNALETRSMFGDKRPNLIIIDEIDGVSSIGGSQNFINTLIQLISAEDNSNTKKDTKRRSKPVKRPIICICNDQFAPALRPLRPHCRIMNFKKSSTALIVEHLKEICSMEKVDVSAHSLSTLCDITDGDLRSCLNSLQFLSESNNQNVTFDMISESSMGSKDTPKSLFYIWDSIFQLPSSKFSQSQKRSFDGALNSGQQKYINLLVSYVMTHGSFNMIVDGCFENYLNAKYIDTYMEKVCSAGEWLCWFDVLDRRVNNFQQQGLYGYSAYPIVAFHNLFATASSKRVEFPRLERQYREVSKTNGSLVSSFYDSLSPLLRRGFSRQTQAIYFVYYALQIIELDSHNINLQLMRPQEKELIQKMVAKMIELNLKYSQNRTADGAIEFELEPPLNQLIKFEAVDKTSNSYFASASQNELKKYITHEIENEAVRQKEQLLQSKSKKIEGTSKSSQSSYLNSLLAITENTKNMLNPSLSASALAATIKPTAKNPFAAFVKRPTSSQMPTSTPSVSQQTKSWFVYLDGYSNAVRTPLYMHEL